MILYHYPHSPFARRVRLTLAMKGLDAELRDARGNEAHRIEMERLNPMRTVPVLVDGEQVVFDSSAICNYLDRKVPTPPLWPSGTAGAEAIGWWTLTDGPLQILVDLGLRYGPLQNDPNFPEVRTSLMGRAQGSLDLLAERVTARGLKSGPLCGDLWSGADIAVFTTVIWFEGLPARGVTFPLAKRMAELGWTLPTVLRTWADQHRLRPDVVALG